MFLVVICTLFLTLLFTIYWYFKKDFNYWKIRNVPYVKPYPFVGNIYSVIREKQSIGEFLTSLYQKTTEPYLGFFLLNRPFLLLRDPKVINNILVRDFKYFADRTVVDNKHDRFGQHLLLLIGGEKWKPLRTSVTPLFSTGKNKSMLPLIDEVCERMVKCIKDTALNKELTNCSELCVRYAVDVIANCFFGLNGHSLDTEDSIFLHFSKKFSDVTFKRNIQMASYFVAPYLAKAFRMHFLDPNSAMFMQNVFFQTIAERKKATTSRGDLIDILLKSHIQDPENTLENDKLASMFMQFLTAGYETSGNSLAFAIYELSRNHDIQSRLRNEINDVIKEYGTVTYEVLQNMKYLDMVVKETNRKYPLLPFLDRRCVKTYKVPGHDLVIEEGKGVYISIFGLHYDPKYFPNPEKFDPERFSKHLNVPSCVYLPFGDGERKCIGFRFASLSTKMVIAKLVLNFNIEKSKAAIDPVTFAHNWIFLVPEKQLNVCFRPLTDIK